MINTELVSIPSIVMNTEFVSIPHIVMNTELARLTCTRFLLITLFKTIKNVKYENYQAKPLKPEKSKNTYDSWYYSQIVKTLWLIFSQM